VLVLDPDELNAGGFLRWQPLTARDSVRGFRIMQGNVGNYWHVSVSRRNEPLVHPVPSVGRWVKYT
jgi:hypothetical protein